MNSGIGNRWQNSDQSHYNQGRSWYGSGQTGVPERVWQVFMKVSIYACNKNNIENDIVWMTLWVWKSLNVNFLQCLEIIWCDRMAKTRYFKIVYAVILTSIQNCKMKLRKDIHKCTFSGNMQPPPPPPPRWSSCVQIDGNMS